MHIGEELLRIKQKTLQLYKNYERWIVAVMKFVGIGLGITAINRTIGSVEFLTNFYLIMAMSGIGMFLPAHYIIVAGMVIATIHLFNISIILGVISAVVGLCTYILVIRFYKKESILILLMMIACAIEMQYLVPMLAALFGVIGAIIPIITGIILFNIVRLMGVTLQSGVLGTDLVEIVEYIINNVFKSLSTNREMFTMIIISTIVYLTVYIIRKQAIDYSAYLAIGVGGVMNILGFLLAVLFLDIQVDVLGVVITTIISVVICIISEYIIRPRDYGRAEVVQFEDEDNYYYVKVVPKITMRSTKTHIEEVYTTESNHQEAQ